MNERWPGTRKIWCYWHFHWSLWIFLLQSFPFTVLSLQHISIFMVMVTLSMTLKTYLHINLLCHSILSFFISSLSHLVQNPLLIAMKHLWQKALHKKLIETDLSLQICMPLPVLIYDDGWSFNDMPFSKVIEEIDFGVKVATLKETFSYLDTKWFKW